MTTTGAAVAQRLEEAVLSVVIGSSAAQRFLEVLDANRDLQRSLLRCRDAEALLALAAAADCPLSRNDLVLLAVTAEHPALPWAGRSRQFARSFALGMARLQCG